MIRKYVYGNPFPTEAVVKDIKKSEDKLPFFEIDNQGRYTYNLSEDNMSTSLKK